VAGALNNFPLVRIAIALDISVAVKEEEPDSLSAKSIMELFDNCAP
jgi:hypothetical protein